MPTVDLAAVSLGTQDYWILSGGIDPVAAINAADGSYLFRNPDYDYPSRLVHGYQDLPGDAVGINTVTQHAVLGRSSAGGTSIYNFAHYYPTTDTYYYVGSTAFPASWTVHTAGITFGAGGGWDVAKVNSCSYGIRYDDIVDLGGRTFYIDHHKVIVDYIASGMFAITFIIPFLGIIATSFDKLMRQLQPRVRYTSKELEQIRQDIRNAQRGYSFSRRACVRHVYT